MDDMGSFVVLNNAVFPHRRRNKGKIICCETEIVIGNESEKDTLTEREKERKRDKEIER